MVKRALAVTMALVLAATWTVAGEKPKRQPRKRPEPVATADYISAVQELIAAATDLEKPGANVQAARDKVTAAAKSLPISTKAVEKMFERGDAQALASMLKSYAYRSLVGKLTAERRKVIAGSDELKTQYDALTGKEKQIAQEKEAFYEGLRPRSTDIESLSKLRDTLVAERDRKAEEAKAKRKAEMEAKRKDRGGRKKKEQ